MFNHRKTSNLDWSLVSSPRRCVYFVSGNFEDWSVNELRNDMDDGHAACFPGTLMGVAVCHHLGKQPRIYKRRTHTQNMHLLELQQISRIKNSKKSPSAHYQFSVFNSFLSSTYAGALGSSHPRFQNEAEQTNPLGAAGCHRHQQAVPLPARGVQRHGLAAPPPRAPPRLPIPMPPEGTGAARVMVKTPHPIFFSLTGRSVSKGNNNTAEESAPSLVSRFFGFSNPNALNT